MEQAPYQGIQSHHVDVGAYHGSLKGVKPYRTTPDPSNGLPLHQSRYELDRVFGFMQRFAAPSAPKPQRQEDRQRV